LNTTKVRTTIGAVYNDYYVRSVDGWLIDRRLISEQLKQAAGEIPEGVGTPEMALVSTHGKHLKGYS